MTVYDVTWEASIEANSHREAAEIVRSWLLDPSATCVVFAVCNSYDPAPTSKLIDLLEDEDD